MRIRKAIAGLLSTTLIVWSATAFAVQPLEITEAFTQVAEADDQVDGTHEHLIVTGVNFLNGGDIDLTLGGFDLIVIYQDEAQVVAELSSMIPPGSYQLVATTGGGTVRHDDFDGVSLGVQGETGAQGPAGADGVDGVDGADGAPGQDGAVGLPGTDGEDGLPGADGDDGAPGAPGADGDPGAPGADGVDGVDGAPGADGLNGLHGMNGQDGANCFDGIGNDVADCIGPPGAQGQPGNLALAGLSCPSGQFVIGFDSLGNLVCGSVDNSQTTPQVSYIPWFDGDYLTLEFSGPIVQADGDYGEFVGGIATGAIIADIGCLTPDTDFSLGGGYQYQFFGEFQNCYGSWRVTLNSSTGTAQTLLLDQFVIQVAWDPDFANFPGGWIRIGATVSSISQNWYFNVLTEEPLPVGTHLPAAEFLNQPQNIFNSRLNIEGYGGVSDLLELGGPTFTYSFSQSSASSCTAGETQTAQCTTIVDAPFLVCQPATRTQACGTGSWGEWSACSGEVISDINGVCP